MSKTCCLLNSLFCFCLFFCLKSDNKELSMFKEPVTLSQIPLETSVTLESCLVHVSQFFFQNEMRWEGMFSRPWRSLQGHFDSGLISLQWTAIPSWSCWPAHHQSVYMLTMTQRQEKKKERKPSATNAMICGPNLTQKYVYKYKASNRRGNSIPVARLNPYSA